MTSLHIHTYDAQLFLDSQWDVILVISMHASSPRHLQNYRPLFKHLLAYCLQRKWYLCLHSVCYFVLPQDTVPSKMRVVLNHDESWQSVAC